MASFDYSWMYSATSEEIAFYFKKQEKLKEIRDSALTTLLKIHFESHGYFYKFQDCISGGFYDVNIFGNGIFEWYIVHHDTMFEDVKKIKKEII